MSETVTLTFPQSSNTYSFEETPLVSESHSENPVYDGRGGQFSTLFERWFGSTGGQSGVGDTPMQAAILSAGAGERTFVVEAQISEGTTTTWGDAADSDSATTKAQHLFDELARSRNDSRNPLVFEWGEYTSSGEFGQLHVVPFERDLDVNYREEPSSAAVRLTLVESADLSETVDDLGAPTAELSLTPKGESQPRIPLPLDTLNAGLQTLRQAVAESGLVDTNGSGSNPLTSVTGLLPQRTRLQGVWRGAKAEDIATTVRDDILGTDDVEAADVNAANIADHPLTGTYSLGESSTVEQPDPRVDGVWAFDLDLRER